MNTVPFMLESFPRAILHVDGDAFFVSVEQAVHPELKGRPVVTGQERGIIACASYEAKALGVKRGVPLFEARRCLSCGNCFECDGCYGSCPEGAVIRLGKGNRYRYDYDKCTGCAVCYEQCPCHAIEMVNEEDAANG